MSKGVYNGAAVGQNPTFQFKIVEQMSANLSTLPLLIEHKSAQIPLTQPLRRCQLISGNANFAHRAQISKPTLNQEL